MHERRSPVFTAIFLAMVVYAAIFETIAWLAPGMEHSADALAAETYDLAAAVVSLCLMWSVIGFLIYYLRQLHQASGRIRKLYRNAA